jgi:hypothetical protein
VGKIAGPKKNQFCFNEGSIDTHGSSLLLQSDLRIKDYLASAVEPARLFRSSSTPKSKDAKIDIFSFEVKFVVVTSANINPAIKLVGLSAGTGSQPLFQTGRTRTHDLILTFGPGLDKPSIESVQTHFTTPLLQAFQQTRSPALFLSGQ